MQGKNGSLYFFYISLTKKKAEKRKSPRKAGFPENIHTMSMASPKEKKRYLCSTASL